MWRFAVSNTFAAVNRQKTAAARTSRQEATLRMTTAFSSTVTTLLSPADIILYTNESSYHTNNAQTLIESSGRKWPRRSIGLVRHRYLALACYRKVSRGGVLLDGSSFDNGSETGSSDGDSLEGSITIPTYKIEFEYYTDEDR